LTWFDLWNCYIYDQIKSLKQYLEIDYQNPIQHYLLGIQYIALGQFENATSELEKSLEISRKQDLKPFWVYCYTDLGKVYHKEGRFKKEKDLYKEAEENYPDNAPLLYRKAILALSQRHEKEAAEYISWYRSVRKEMSASLADISSGLASIYEEADLPEKAEEYYRQALWSEPENPWMLYLLARFLIEKDRNINEGLELIDKALKINPQSSYFFDSKGWGLYKQSRYNEALECLEKSWNLRSFYNHEIYLHLEAASNAVKNQK